MRSGPLFRTLALAALMVVISAGSADAQFTGAYKRMKLLEQFTSATCNPCRTAAPFVEAAVKLESDVISIRYHMNYPAPGDPWNVMNPNDPSVRHDLYRISGIPYLRVGGTMNTNPASAGIAGINNLISQIPPTSMAKITVEQKGGTIEVKVTTDRALSNAKLFFATVQRSVTIANLTQTLPGSNGETTFGDVMMYMYPDANGTEINQAAGETKTYTFTPGFGSGQTWNPANLYGIAFIQDNESLEIIQAGASVTSTTPPAFDYFEASKVTSAITGVYERVDRGATASKTITLSNPGSSPVTVDLSVTNAEALNQIGFGATIEPARVTVPANGTATSSLKVTGSDRSVFVSVNASTAPTDGLGGVLPQMFYLVNGGKIVNYYGLGNEGAPLTQIAAQASTKYNRDVVYMPFATDILTNYPINEFDGAIFAFDAYWLNLRGTALTTIEDALRAGKGVWIQTQAGMYAVYERNGSSPQFNATRAFYANTAGIRYTRIAWRANFDVNNNPTSLLTFPARGVNSDPIGNGISFTGNAASQAFPYYALGTDVMALTTGSLAKPVMYYDNNPNDLAMVRVQPSTGGRLVYSSFGPEVIAADATRNQLVERVIDWLVAADAQAPKIAVSQGTLNFGTVNVDGTKEISFTLTNTGNAELSITGMNITGVDATSFDITEGRPINNNPIKVGAGQTHTVKVAFMPTVQKNNFGAVLEFVSNATESPNVQLRGASTTTSVETDVVSETGAIRLTLNGANPVTATSTIRVEANGSMTVSVMDAAGRTVSTLFNGAVNGVETIDLNAGALAAGMYTVVASNGADRAVLTVIVTR